MNAYHSFSHEQRPLLPKDVSPGEREKLLSQRWKALSKAEKANYKSCDDTTQTPRRSAYSAFCRAQRPLLPPTLPNATREEVLGQLWAALPEREREAYLVGGSRAPVPVPAPAARVPAPAPAPASVPLEKDGSEKDGSEKDGSKNKKAKTAASMVSPSAPENTAAPLTAPLAPLTASAPPFLALTAPSSAPTSPTASHSLSTDANDDEYEWEKYLNLDEGFISSSLASLDALQVT